MAAAKALDFILGQRHLLPNQREDAWVEYSEFEAVAALTLSQMRKIALPIDPRPGIDDKSYR
jgi:hypothetical protein